MKREDLSTALAAPTRRTPTIHLWSATGEGPTPRAAFDAALVDAGVEHCDRLRESSLIAPQTRIVRAGSGVAPPGEGRRHCVVMAQMQHSRAGQHAHAGIGWVQRRDDGCGLFIDLHDDDRERLERDLHAAFDAIRCLRDAAWGPVQVQVASRLCTRLPVCALVVAAYSGEACDTWGDS